VARAGRGWTAAALRLPPSGTQYPNQRRRRMPRPFDWIVSDKAPGFNKFEKSDIGPILDPGFSKFAKLLISLARPTGIEPVFPP
jgi:hypothetical protein